MLDTTGLLKLCWRSEAIGERGDIEDYEVLAECSTRGEIEQAVVDLLEEGKLDLTDIGDLRVVVDLNWTVEAHVQSEVEADVGIFDHGLPRADSSVPVGSGPVESDGGATDPDGSDRIPSDPDGSDARPVEIDDLRGHLAGLWLAEAGGEVERSRLREAVKGTLAFLIRMFEPEDSGDRSPEGADDRRKLQDAIRAIRARMIESGPDHALSTRLCYAFLKSRSILQEIGVLDDDRTVKIHARPAEDADLDQQFDEVFQDREDETAGVPDPEDVDGPENIHVTEGYDPSELEGPGEIEEPPAWRRSPEYRKGFRAAKAEAQATVEAEFQARRRISDDWERLADAVRGYLDGKLRPEQLREIVEAGEAPPEDVDEIPDFEEVDRDNEAQREAAIHWMRTIVGANVAAERRRQDDKWGPIPDLPADRHAEKWLRILMEEIGEAAATIEDVHGKRGYSHEFWMEMTQVAAVALSCLEFYVWNYGWDLDSYNAEKFGVGGVQHEGGGDADD